MAKGTVKWFNHPKRYDFVSRENSPDVFVRFSAIQREGFETLAEGQEVKSDVVDDPKALQAASSRAA